MVEMGDRNEGGLSSRVRFSPVFALIGAVATWIHGVTVGVVLGDSMLNRFILFTVIFVAPVISLWVFAKTKAVRRLAASLVYFLCALQATAWSLSVAWHRNPKKIDALPDLGHDLLGPKWEKWDIGFFGQTFFTLDADILPDIFLCGALVGAFGFALAHELRWLIIRRALTIYSTLMAFRCFTILATSLPDSHPRCRDVTPEGDDEVTGGATLESLFSKFRELFILSIKMMVPVGQVTCGDMVFSGHTMLLVLSALCWHTYYPRTENPFNLVKFLVWSWSFMGLICIIGTRLHYTLDVLLAWYLATTVWSSYHRIANDVIRGRRFCMVWLFDILIIYPSIEYFEAGVGPEGLCTGINARTVEEQDENPLASPRSHPSESTYTPRMTNIIKTDSQVQGDRDIVDSEDAEKDKEKSMSTRPTTRRVRSRTPARSSKKKK